MPSRLNFTLTTPPPSCLSVEPPVLPPVALYRQIPLSSDCLALRIFGISIGAIALFCFIATPQAFRVTELGVGDKLALPLLGLFLTALAGWMLHESVNPSF